MQQQAVFSTAFIRRRRWRITLAVASLLLITFFAHLLLAPALLVTCILNCRFPHYTPTFGALEPALRWDERGLSWHTLLSDEQIFIQGPSYSFFQGSGYCRQAFIHWRNIAALNVEGKQLSLHYYSGTLFADKPDDEPIPRNLGEPDQQATLHLERLDGDASAIACELQHIWRTKTIHSSARI